MDNNDAVDKYTDSGYKPSHSWIFFRYHNIMEVESMARYLEFVPDVVLDVPIYDSQ